MKCARERGISADRVLLLDRIGNICVHTRFGTGDTTISSASDKHFREYIDTARAPKNVFDHLVFIYALVILFVPHILAILMIEHDSRLIAIYEQHRNNSIWSAFSFLSIVHASWFVCWLCAVVAIGVIFFRHRIKWFTRYSSSMSERWTQPKFQNSIRFVGIN